LRSDTERVPWRRDIDEFARWCNGRTGFPLIDAALRQLQQTGWMHNRLRMVTAMFLSKYLLLDWRWGERYFMEHLIDGDLAANNGGWQWSASTGTDAVPYFRLLSPLRQAERFDSDASFCKKFLPELRELPAKIILQPGHPLLLATGYPAPMVDLKFARNRALNAFSQSASAMPIDSVASDAVQREMAV
jgi:deoxyribodipyrimidine photo-lyase